MREERIVMKKGLTKKRLLLGILLFTFLMLAGPIREVKAATTYAMATAQIPVYNDSLRKIGTYYKGNTVEVSGAKAKAGIFTYYQVNYCGNKRWINSSGYQLLKFSAGYIPNGYYNLKSGVSTSNKSMKMDVYNDWRNSDVNIYKENDANAQVFRLVKTSSAQGGVYVLMGYSTYSSTSPQALTLENKTNSRYGNGYYAVMRNYNTRSSFQKWKIYNAGGGYYYLKNLATSYFLTCCNSTTNNNTPLRGMDYTGSKVQKWKLEDAEPCKILNGNYSFSSEVRNNRWLNVVNGRSLNVRTWLGNNNQIFKVTHVGNGWHTIQNVNTKEYITGYYSYSIKENRTILEAYMSKSKGGSLSKWQFRERNDGSCYIYSGTGTKFYLSVCGNSTSNEARVWIWNKKEENAKGEKWWITKR